MSVRQSLLAILAQGPCYGYQLRAEFERRTGGSRPLNVGQIYNTLDRLERDGFVARADADDQGHVFWSITDAGRDDVGHWLASPLKPAQDERDELAMKIALAATLPGADALALVETQRRATAARLEELRGSRGDGGPGAEELARAVVDDALIARKEAELAWLERTAARLASAEPDISELRLSTRRPRRGRPARSVAEPVADGLAVG